MTAFVALSTPADTAPVTEPGVFKVAVRRITEHQYRHTIADVFGPDIKINARFEPEKREDGLLAIGSTQLSITTSGLEQYLALANSVSDQALAEPRRAATVGCAPVNPNAADAKCARSFIAKYGERLFRRPLTDGEIARRVAIANVGATQKKDFYEGLDLALVSMLAAPEFLMRVENAETDPANPGKHRLDSYTKASRLSYLLWDAAPDAELLAAAKSGALHTDAGVQAQIARMTASPRLKDGASAFFTDMLQLEHFDGLNKDPASYPKFTQAVADSAKEETLKFMVDALIVRNADYRDIFTTRSTYLNRPLAALYKAPFKNTAGDWMPYTFEDSSGRSGVLTQVTFLSLFAHPGASSPTKRGVKLHEIFMCQPTPEPPADVDFSKVQALDKGTVRTRLLDHMTNEGCATCHRVSDPAGLALEHFDGAGQLRRTENGKPIDVSAEINGVTYVGAQGLGKMMHDNPAVPGCLVRNVFYYGVGRPSDFRDEDYLAKQTKAFAADGYRVPQLFARIASSPEFFKVVVPAGLSKTAAAPSTKTP